tara:strand:+ start:25 stop:270 length:246 start_codon:yes stop_codon:yes gene_type:complete
MVANKAQAKTIIIMKTIEQFLKEHKENNNTEDAVYSSYHYDAMEQYANERVIEELENIAKEIYKAKEIGVPIANRIKELKL